MERLTEEQLEEMIQSSMADLRKESGGDFDEYAEGFFRAGFKCAVIALMLRDALNKMPDTGKREN
jgi:hypothetical protein